MFCRFCVSGVCLLFFLTPGFAKPFSEMFPGKRYSEPFSQAFAEMLDYQQGKIILGAANVSLNVPAEFYFLGAKDAKKVITEAWGNPSTTAEGALGMIFPAKSRPLDDTWAVVITYDEDGYVSDVEAEKIDYSKLLRQMQQATTEANDKRRKQGYPAIRLVGWASKPFYDQSSHKLHWARELEFGGDPAHTLNYEVRALGRRGVLNMNFVAQMDDLQEITQVIPSVMAIPEFNSGSRYADFLPGVDKVAAYGIGGLIAGKIASKAGLFASALVFLKKAWVLVFAAIAGFFGFLRRAYSGRQS